MGRGAEDCEAEVDEDLEEVVRGEGLCKEGVRGWGEGVFGEGEEVEVGFVLEGGGEEEEEEGEGCF